MTPPRESKKTNSIDRMLSGGGEMGELMRSVDWSRTPLGPMTDWPQSLLTAVSICLFSRFPIFIWWGQERINIYNDAYRPILGANKHPQAMGQPGQEAWSEIWNIIGPMADSVYREGKATWSENQMLPIDRYGFTEEAYFTFSYTPIFDEAGGIGGIFTAVQETTKQILGERRLKILYELSDIADDGKSAQEACQLVVDVLTNFPADVPFALLYLHDAEGARLIASAGVPPDSDLHISDIPLDADSPWLLKDGQPVHINHLGERFQNIPARLWPEAPHTAVTLPISGGFLVMGISPRLALDHEYLHFCDLVAAHVTTALNNARSAEAERKRIETLAELDRAKTEFFSNVSHEFRTPLTLLLGPLEDMLQNDDAAFQRENLQIAHRSSLRLLKLVNTLLEFSRIQASRIDAAFEPTDLAALTADLASSFRAAVERSGLRLVIDCPPLPAPVYVDHEMWEKIVLNLLSNAFKFTFNGEITVSLHPTEREVQLVVRDTGIGISASELPLIFERFHRVRGAQARTHEGSGIGLALVAELVRFHGGHVAATSEPGVGTTFTVSIPLGSAHLPQDQIGAQRSLASTASGTLAYVTEAMQWIGSQPSDDVIAAVDAEKLLQGLTNQPQDARILIVDDNADMRGYLQRLLEKRYQVETANDGLAALDLISQNQPDLILSDVMMPNLDGFGLLQQIRTNPEWNSIPLILLSARAGGEARIEGLTAGADDYIVKPFSSRELIARIDAQLQLNRLRKEVRASEATVENIIQSIADPFYVLDSNSRFIYANARAQQMWGKTREELINRNIWEVFPQGVTTQAYTEIQRAIDTQQPGAFETFSEFLNLWVEVNIYPSNQGIAVYFRDITERKEAEQLRDRLEVVVSNIDSGFVIIDKDWRYIYVNRGAGEIATKTKGHTREQLLQMTLDEAFPELVGSHLYKELHRAMREQKPIAFEEYVEPFDMWAEYRIDPLGGDLAIFTTDITERKRVESALRETEERLRMVMDSATDYAIYALDTEGDIYSWSAGAERVFGYSESEALGQNVAMLYLPEDREYNLPAYEMQSAIAFGYAENERWLMHKDGTRFFASGMVRLIHDSNGSFRGFARVSRDATARKLVEDERNRLNALLEEERQRLGSIVANVPGVIWESHFDPQTRTVHLEFISSYVERLLGYTVDEALAIVDFWDTIMHPDDLLIVNEAAEQTRYTGGTQTVAFRALHKDGRYMSLEAHVTVIPDSVNGRRVRGVMMDISERQRFAQVQERYAQMLRRSNEELQQFAYIASHDLQEPLRMVTSYLQLLERRYGTQLETDAREFISFAVDGAARMRELITALLDYSRVEGSEKQFEEIAAESALNTALSNMTLKIEDSGAVITHDPLPNIKADPVQITQLFQNLISNALKFHGDNPPRIHIGVTRVDTEWQFSVSDNGIGIPPEAINRIFVIFQRLHSRDSYPGSGIGLAICKKVVERHGGRIWVESSPGQGATFYFTLPV